MEKLKNFLLLSYQIKVMFVLPNHNFHNVNMVLFIYMKFNKIMNKLTGLIIGVVSLSSIIGISVAMRHKQSSILFNHHEVSDYAFENIVGGETNKAIILLTGGPRPIINKRQYGGMGHGYNTYVLNQGHESQ